MSVDRCVCHDVTFAALRALAKESDARAGTVDADHAVVEHALKEIRRATGCTTGCGTCEPYIRLMLRTGRTRFAVFPQTT